MKSSRLIAATTAPSLRGEDEGSAMLESYSPVFTTATSFGLGQSMLPTGSVSTSDNASMDIVTDTEYTQLREKILDPHRQDESQRNSPPSPLAPVAALIISDSYRLK